MTKWYNSTPFHIFSLISCGFLLFITIPHVLNGEYQQYTPFMFIWVVYLTRSLKYLFGSEDSSVQEEAKAKVAKKLNLNPMKLTTDNVRQLYRDGYESLAFRQFCKLKKHKSYTKEELAVKFADFVKK
ncbi:hypothetical protein [Zooshikella harenae]|uniref:Uncharacterized protein n=1 Tax=Zooshikella harenae TaxID=2827238 RepID=A0ABS5Z721_9GAMM|nr:hypothetical protein [Zooshikella harenae]MBU2709853.1 hypothetical protein [Zooshikella harenae]